MNIFELYLISREIDCSATNCVRSQHDHYEGYQLETKRYNISCHNIYYLFKSGCFEKYYCCVHSKSTNRVIENKNIFAAMLFAQIQQKYGLMQSKTK